MKGTSSLGFRFDFLKGTLCADNSSSNLLFFTMQTTTTSATNDAVEFQSAMPHAVNAGRASKGRPGYRQDHPPSRNEQKKKLDAERMKRVM